MLYLLIIILCAIIPLLGAVAIFTLFERKIMSSIQRRRGPNVVGFWGILQAFADGLKLILKETVFLSKSNLILYIIAPVIILTFSLLNWLFIPFNFKDFFLDYNYSLFYIFIFSSCSVYGIILGGWASNSKYAFLSVMRAVAQTISYEISISLILLPLIICSGSLNLIDIVYAQKNIWFFCLFPILAIIFFICILAETNRAPFDLPEAEGEIVAGYNLEYGSMTFALFFLGEYCNIYAMSALFSILFLGGWGWPLKLFYINNLGFALAVKTVFICYLFILVRANLPRYRFDQLLYLGWKIFIPIGLGYSVFTGGLLLDINFINFYIPKEIFFEMNHILQNSFNI